MTMFAEYMPADTLAEALKNSPIFTPSHKNIIVDSAFHEWEEYRENKWIYNGFYKFVENIFSGEGYRKPWVIERQATHEVHLNGYIDGPTFGLHYEVYYNSVCIGNLDVSPSYIPSFGGNYDDFESGKLVEMQFYWLIHKPELLPYAKLKCLCGFSNNEKMNNFDEAIAEYMWDSPANQVIDLKAARQFSRTWLIEQNYLNASENFGPVL